MSCAGNKWLKTAAMDRLARDGVRFERGYCANPVCMPSRTAMATGVMPGRFGVYSNGAGAQLWPRIKGRSMGELMKRAGYDTFYGGKVHMHAALGPANGAYDESSRGQRGRLARDCLQFMTKKRDKPFFAVASFINPHDICFAHRAKLKAAKGQRSGRGLYEQAIRLPDDQLPPLPENFELQKGEPAAVEAHTSTTACTPARTMRKEYGERDWRIYRWMYCRFAEQVDKHIGVMLDGLEKAGLAGNTVIVFTSDHGNMDASHRLASKSQMYEESVGVPMIISGRGIRTPGRVDSQHLVSAGLDILPTICDYAGIKAPAHCQGRSLRPLTEDEHANEWRPYVTSENHFSRMLCTGRFKYCSYGTGEGDEMLVDLESDPGEMTNLAANAEHSDTLKRHRALLREWSEVSKDTKASGYLRPA